MSGQTKIENSPVVLKEIALDDLPKIAEVHLTSFPESALTKLGSPIVERYYRWQLTGPHEKVRAVAAFIDDECAGFSFSGVFNDSISGFINHNKYFLVGEVLKRPQIALNSLFRERLYSGLKLLRSFRDKKRASEKTVKKEKKESFGILSIAVSVSRQKYGIGKMLMNDAEIEAVKCGYKIMHLTVSPANENAVRFYEKLNWRKSESGRMWKGLMIKALP